MKKRIIFLIFAFLISFTTGSCGRISNNNESNKDEILASFTVLADIVENVVKDDFKVRSITKPGMEVHGYQPTPSDLINASKAFFT